MSEEDGFRLRKSRRGEEDSIHGEDFGDPYLRDENGRPIDILKRGGRRPSPRRAPDEGLRKYLMIGGVFAGVLAISGQLFAAAIVAASTFAVALVAKLRR
ncbi:MAG: hypothetical protein QW420_02950 [Candidatus Caldarchaeum sp.]